MMSCCCGVIEDDSSEELTIKTKINRPKRQRGSSIIKNVENNSVSFCITCYQEFGKIHSVKDCKNGGGYERFYITMSVNPNNNNKLDTIPE
jgi:hypothetical protein